MKTKMGYDEFLGWVVLVMGLALIFWLVSNLENQKIVFDNAKMQKCQIAAVQAVPDANDTASRGEVMQNCYDGRTN